MFMSVPLRNERRRGLAGLQRVKAPVEWPRSEDGNPTEGSLLRQCYGNRRQTNELEERSAPSSVRVEDLCLALYTPRQNNERASGRFRGSKGKLKRFQSQSDGKDNANYSDATYCESAWQSVTLTVRLKICGGAGSSG